MKSMTSMENASQEDAILQLNIWTRKETAKNAVWGRIWCKRGHMLGGLARIKNAKSINIMI